MSGGRDGVLRAGTAVDVVDVPEDVGRDKGVDRTVCVLDRVQSVLVRWDPLVHGGVVDVV